MNNKSERRRNRQRDQRKTLNIVEGCLGPSREMDVRDNYLCGTEIMQFCAKVGKIHGFTKPFPQKHKKDVLFNLITRPKEPSF